jgi:putative restriction endonuclease
MEKTAADYIRLFSDLRRDGIPGRWPQETNRRAPHKPLLLISVIDEFLARPDRSARIEVSEKLEAHFKHYWSRVLPQPHKTTMALPFYHLKNDGFWHLQAVPGQERTLASSIQIRKSTRALRRAVSEATLDDALHRLLTRRDWAQHLRSVLVVNYFVPELHSVFVDLKS